MNESKLLKNPNKCPIITTNLNERKLQNSHGVATPNSTVKSKWCFSKIQFLDYLNIINVP